MRERPILFSAPMVRAILSGTKTVTRRIVKPQPQMVTDHSIVPWDGNPSALHRLLAQSGKHCPYGQPGDRLWVREAWAQPTTLDPGPTFYRADYPDCVPAHFENVPQIDQIKWKPSIHMRRDQSRILLEILGVRVARLQDISEADAKAEGVYADAGCNGMFTADGNTYTTKQDGAVGGYAKLWESINGDDSWAANLWVWVVEFKKLYAGETAGVTP